MIGWMMIGSMEFSAKRVSMKLDYAIEVNDFLTLQTSSKTYSRRVVYVPKVCISTLIWGVVIAD